ncbi:MAG TPA: hypothetical protein VK212_10835 [Lentimicrobium sp.]|nr:hypothetical protein [Lentimicrobium sp.]
MKTGRIAAHVFLLVIPFIIALTSVSTINERGKIWYFGDYDPAYAYLYNSLNITNGLAPGHYDHPGTNMQLLGAVVLKVSWTIDHHGYESLTGAVLKDPEYYLRILCMTVAVFGAVMVLLLGMVVLWFSKNLWYALLLQATPFISGLILYNSFTRVSQESMLMVSSLTLAAFTIVWYFRHDHYSLKKWAVVFGIISGFGLVSKIIFLPLMIIPLLLIRKNKSRLIYLLTAGITFIVFTIPIIIRYPSMAWWFVNLFIHSGIYGTGDASVVDFSKYFVSLKQLITGNPAYSAVFVFNAIFLVILLIRYRNSRISDQKPAVKILAGVFLVQLAGFLITAKHPKLAYLLPYELLSGIPLVLFFDIFFSRIRNFTVNNIAKGILILPLLFFGIRYAILKKEKLYSNDKLQLNEQAWKRTLASGDAVIAINPGPSPVAAMFFANVYAADKYQDELQALYPDFYIFDTYSNSIVNWKRQAVPFTEILQSYNYNVSVTGYKVDLLLPLLSVHKNISMEKQGFGKTEVGLLRVSKL